VDILLTALLAVLALCLTVVAAIAETAFTYLPHNEAEEAVEAHPDTLAARGVRKEAVDILTPALAAGQSWRTVYVCGLQEGTWPNTTVRGSLLSTGDLVDLCDARLRQRAQQAEQQAARDALLKAGAISE